MFSRKIGKLGITLLLVSLTLSGCAVVYESQQESARKTCERLPNPQEMRDYLYQTQRNYEQYGKQRDALQSGQSEQPLDKKTPAY